MLNGEKYQFQAEPEYMYVQARGRDQHQEQNILDQSSAVPGLGI